MPRVITSASLVLAGVIAGSALSAFAADPTGSTRIGISGKASEKSKAAPATVEVPMGNEPVEYRFMVLSMASAPTAEHEKQLNALGADGWRVMAPIYSGGILNSYLMARTHPAK